MPFDMDRETREKFSDDGDERAPNFLWLIGAVIAGAALWYGIIKALGWIMGAL